MSPQHPAAPRYFLETFGCQMNVNDSEKVAGLLEHHGYEAAASPESADVVFINTCAVREKAAEKLDHRLREFRQLPNRPAGQVVAIGGCVPQLEGESIARRTSGVDVVVGTHNLIRLPEFVARARQGEGTLLDLDRSVDSFQVPNGIVAHGSSVRAYVTIMEGCNHVCSFCVVPRTRGPEVCRSASAVLAEVRHVVDRGFPEVMLLGQTVNAWRHEGMTFADLLAEVAAVPGLERLRFTTSHPEHADGTLARAFAEIPTLCPYLHLPPQSGSDRVLAAMRRGYTRAEYEQTIARLREARADLAISGDVIVGHPGEDEADFEATLSLLDTVGFDGLFAFMYSPRPGTTAFREGDPVPAAEKRRRLQVVLQRQQRWQRARNEALVGSCQEVLVERVDEPGRVSGRTPHFRIVHCDGPEGLVGQRLEVDIDGAGPNSLRGRRRTLR